MNPTAALRTRDEEDPLTALSLYHKDHVEVGPPLNHALPPPKYGVVLRDLDQYRGPMVKTSV